MRNTQTNRPADWTKAVRFVTALIQLVAVLYSNFVA